MENSSFIDDFPFETSIYKGFSMAMINSRLVYLSYHKPSPWISQEMDPTTLTRELFLDGAAIRCLAFEASLNLFEQDLVRFPWVWVGFKWMYPLIIWPYYIQGFLLDNLMDFVAKKPEQKVGNGGESMVYGFFAYISVYYVW